MNQEQLLAFLRENLTVRLDISHRQDFYNNKMDVKVQLRLGEEVISESEDSFPLPES